MKTWQRNDKKDKLKIKTTVEIIKHLNGKKADGQVLGDGRTCWHPQYNNTRRTMDPDPTHMVGSLKMNTTLEYSTRVVQEGDRRCKKSTLNDLAYLTPLRIPLMNPVIINSERTVILSSIILGYI